MITYKNKFVGAIVRHRFSFLDVCAFFVIVPMLSVSFWWLLAIIPVSFLTVTAEYFARSDK